jgi:hypothetical protein
MGGKMRYEDGHPVEDCPYCKQEKGEIHFNGGDCIGYCDQCETMFCLYDGILFEEVA